MRRPLSPTQRQVLLAVTNDSPGRGVGAYTPYAPGKPSFAVPDQSVVRVPTLNALKARGLLETVPLTHGTAWRVTPAGWAVVNALRAVSRLPRLEPTGRMAVSTTGHGP